MARCTTASPRPLPPGFVVKNGSKSRSRFSGAMPGPSSLTLMATAPSRSVALLPTCSGDGIETSTCTRPPGGDAFEPLRAKPERIHALLVGDVLKDGGCRAIRAAAVAVGVRGRDANGKAFLDGGDHALRARRSDTRAYRSLERVGKGTGDSANLLQHRFSDQ